MKRFCEYDTVIFDCDGVLFDSNFFKESAFLSIAQRYGDDAVVSINKILTDYAGSSRYVLFEKFIHTLSGITLELPSINALLDDFSEICLKNYRTCIRTNALAKLSLLDTANWLVVSSSDENELRVVMDDLDLAGNFSGGIYGSPNSKFEIINREIANGVIKKNVLYFGDGKIDIEVCDNFGFDLIFVADWTAMEGYKHICSQKGIQTVPSLDDYYATQMSFN